MTQDTKSVLIEIIKIAGVLATAWIGGYLAIDKLAAENRNAIDQASIRHKLELEKSAADNLAALERIGRENIASMEKETHTELVRRFIGNPNDLNDVFRTLTLLTRIGLLRQDEETRKSLIKEIETFYGQRFDDILIGNLSVAPALNQERTVFAISDRQQSSDTPNTTPRPRAGDELALQVSLLNDSSSTVRSATTQRLLTATRDQGLSEEDQVRVLRVLVRMTDDAQIRGLSAIGRYNLIYVLPELPWEKKGKDWANLASDLRENIRQLEQRENMGTVAIGPQTRSFIDRLKERLGA